ncbi:hypothetical protein [Streptomyces phaeochromogenes]|uniref:hypothetical protein n=1 Tax=Streptomyces phaeochromogenes TaxID=1923 RepID=UPI002DD8B4A2|nr:hypothetical protein [Streptomyces phaeochromogenes]WRZ34478.1 hypothetical protein OG931_45480 [Streptomyces phaeochromogenes]
MSSPPLDPELSAVLKVLAALPTVRYVHGGGLVLGSNRISWSAIQGRRALRMSSP